MENSELPVFEQSHGGGKGTKVRIVKEDERSLILEVVAGGARYQVWRKDFVRYYRATDGSAMTVHDGPEEGT